MSADKKNLLLLFDRPLEPVIMPKGKNKTKFDVPKELLTKRFVIFNNDYILFFEVIFCIVMYFYSYKDAPEIQSRLGLEAEDVVPVTAHITIPNLQKAMALDRKAPFSLLIPQHREIATFLITIFMGKIEHPGEGPFN